MPNSTSDAHTPGKLMGLSLLGVLGLAVIVSGLVIYSMTRKKVLTTDFDEV